MKTTGACPKCQSRELVRIPGWTGYGGAGNNVSVGMTIFASVTVTRFLCASCGYSEEWIESAEDVQRVREKYGDWSGPE